MLLQRPVIFIVFVIVVVIVVIDIDTVIVIVVVAPVDIVIVLTVSSLSTRRCRSINLSWIDIRQPLRHDFIARRHETRAF